MIYLLSALCMLKPAFAATEESPMPGFENTILKLYANAYDEIRQKLDGDVLIQRKSQFGKYSADSINLSAKETYAILVDPEGDGNAYVLVAQLGKENESYLQVDPDLQEKVLEICQNRPFRIKIDRFKDEVAFTGKDYKYLTDEQKHDQSFHSFYESCEGFVGGRLAEAPWCVRAWFEYDGEELEMHLMQPHKQVFGGYPMVYRAWFFSKFIKGDANDFALTHKKLASGNKLVSSKTKLKKKNAEIEEMRRKLRAHEEAAKRASKDIERLEQSIDKWGY